MEYKGQNAQVIMMGNRQRIAGWRGELCVVVIKYGPRESERYDVVPDSTDAADQDRLPEVKTFDDKNEALMYALQMDRNKQDWR
jgi:hypothetical protein